MTYEYNVVTTDMGWIISRKKEMGRLMVLQYLNGYGLWQPNKGSAKVFYDKAKAESAIGVLRIKDKKKAE